MFPFKSLPTSPLVWNYIEVYVLILSQQGTLEKRRKKIPALSLTWLISSDKKIVFNVKLQKKILLFKLKMLFRCSKAVPTTHIALTIEKNNCQYALLTGAPHESINLPGHFSCWGISGFGCHFVIRCSALITGTHTISEIDRSLD